MNVHYQLNDNMLMLVMTDLAPHYHQAAQETGYSLTDEGFVREMVVTPAALQPAFLDRIVLNCQTFLDAMFAQKAGLQPVPWDQTLLAFLKRIEGYELDWWLMGSTALAARGIDVSPGDVDLCTAEDDALILQDLLMESLVQPVQDTTGWSGRWFGRAFLGSRLEWLGGVNEAADAVGISDFGPIAHTRLETIEWRGYTLRVPPLDLQLDVSLRRGLVDRADKIRQALT
jgi:hypothetical protein